MKALIASLFALAILAALGTTATLAQQGAPDPLAGSSWMLVSYGAPGAATPLIPGSSVTLTFEGTGQITGHGGCNGYSGGYTTEGDRLVVGQIVSTMVACADDQVTRQEQAYFAALGSSGRFQRTADRLTIDYAGGQLTFASLAGAPRPTPDHFENLDSPVDLLASYYNAIIRQDYQRAYGYWETPPHAFDEFASGFADTVDVQVIVEPPTRFDGAAGSVYVSIPTVLIALHADSAHETFAGCFVMRRSNLMPPDVPEVDVWHLYDADLSQVPNDAVIPVLLRQACSEEEAAAIEAAG